MRPGCGTRVFRRQGVPPIRAESVVTLHRSMTDLVSVVSLPRRREGSCPCPYTLLRGTCPFCKDAVQPVLLLGTGASGEERCTANPWSLGSEASRFPREAACRVLPPYRRAEWRLLPGPRTDFVVSLHLYRGRGLEPLSPSHLVWAVFAAGVVVGPVCGMLSRLISKIGRESLIVRQGLKNGSEACF